MKRVFSLIFALAGFCSLAIGNTTAPEWPDFAEGIEVSSDLVYKDEEVKARLEQMPCLVQPQYNTLVRAYVMTYLVRNPENSERILGRSVIYFPIIEKWLAEKGLPNGLKYLPVVESALNPRAVSRAGATGLWQFMESTGKIYGLDINWTVDERSDPEKSTIAALEHLTDLYRRFDSWELALAAYNSGAGRVSRAIKRSRSRNFWKLQRYLPRETRNYVPAFIAATYMMQYYDHHQLTPTYPSLDLQMTESMQVSEYLSFFRVAQVTDIPLEIIELLNPSYPRGFIPGGGKGNYIVLPKRVIPALKDYLVYQESNHPMALEALEGVPVSWEQAVNADLDKYYLRSIYVVNEGDNLEGLANLFQVTPLNLMAWNNLARPEIAPGQELTVYHIKSVKRYLPESVKPAPTLPTLAPKPAQQADPELGVTSLSEPFVRGKFLCYRLSGLETLPQIVRHVENVSLEEIIELNNITPASMPKPGTVIRLKKL